MMNRKAVILDANVLALFIVGTASTSYIRDHKAVRGAFDANDYKLLESYVLEASDIIATPHLLAETSNLLHASGSLKEPARGEVLVTFAAFIKSRTELFLPSRQAVFRQEFMPLGLTDSSLLEFTKLGMVLITADRALYSAVLANDCEAILFG